MRVKERVTLLFNEREVDSMQNLIRVEWFDNPLELSIYELGIYFPKGAFLFVGKNNINDKLRILGKKDYKRDLKKKDVIKYASRPMGQEDFEDVLVIEPIIKSTDKIESGIIIRKRIEMWLTTTNYKSFRDEIAKRVKGQQELDKVLINVYNYFENIYRGEKNKNNILIAAPSGCGKTETYRALRDYFKSAIPRLPIGQIDMTSITEEGFKGSDTKAVISPLLENNETGGIGIIFMDEFDKKIVPSYSGRGSNVNAAVQAQLLATIEGREYQEEGINTENTLFIGLGAFDECRKKKGIEIKHIGFGQENEKGEDHYSPITREDIINLGGSYELLGRFGTIVNYNKLPQNIIDEIIDDCTLDLMMSTNLDIVITDDFRERIREKANTEFGCRIIRGILTDAVMNAYIDIKNNESECKVDTVFINDIDDYLVLEKEFALDYEEAFDI